MKLNNYLKERLSTDKMTYIFLDKVYKLPLFENLYNRNYVNVYITDSNVHMLSSELAMLLSGRCIEFKMRLFSFHDYMAKEEVFAEFMKTGKIPSVAAMNRTEKNRAVSGRYLQQYHCKREFYYLK